MLPITTDPTAPSAAAAALGVADNDFDDLARKFSALPPDRKALIRAVLAAEDQKRRAERTRDELASKWSRLTGVVERRRIALSALEAVLVNAGAQFRSVAKFDAEIIAASSGLQVEVLTAATAVTASNAAAAVGEACRGDAPNILKFDIQLDVEQIADARIAGADRTYNDACNEVARLHAELDAAHG